MMVLTMMALPASQRRLQGSFRPRNAPLLRHGAQPPRPRKKLCCATTRSFS